MLTIQNVAKEEDIAVRDAIDVVFAKRCGLVAVKGVKLLYDSPTLKLYHSVSLQKSDFSLYEEYLNDVYKHRVNVPIMSQDYRNLFEYGKILGDRMKVASSIMRCLPKRMRYYIPGDGHGCFSYMARKYGLSYISSEPSCVGNIPFLMGVITAQEKFDTRYDTGNVLIACNLSKYIDLSLWTGPMLIYDESREEWPEFECVKGTQNRLWYRGFKYKWNQNDMILGFTKREQDNFQRYMIKLRARNCDKKFCSIDPKHLAMFKMLNVNVLKLVHDDHSECIRCGIGVDEIDLFQNQDHKQAVKGFFIGKRNDLVYYKDFLPQRFKEKIFFRRSDAFSVVTCGFREGLYVAGTKSEEGWTFLRVRRIKDGKFVVIRHGTIIVPVRVVSSYQQANMWNHVCVELDD